MKLVFIILNCLYFLCSTILSFRVESRRYVKDKGLLTVFMNVPKPNIITPYNGNNKLNIEKFLMMYTCKICSGRNAQMVIYNLIIINLLIKYKYK